MHTLRQEIYKKHLEFTMPFFKFSGSVFTKIADFFVRSKYSPLPFLFNNISAILIISACSLFIAGLFYFLTERKVLSDKFKIFWIFLVGIIIAFWIVFCLLPIFIMTIIIVILFSCFLPPTIIYILLFILLIIFKITFISPLMLVFITLILTISSLYSKLKSSLR